MRWRTFRLAFAAPAVLALTFVGAACDADSDDAAYLGTWDPVMLTHQGEVIALENGGIAFRADQVCFLRFSEECHDAAYTQRGDVIAVTMGGDPDYYLLYVPFDGYLMVKDISDRPVLYVRRQAQE